MRLPTVIAIIALLLLPSAAWAQAETAERPFAWDVVKGVVLDPTTYAPAIITHQAMTWDWRTSQVLFANGWVEANPRFTVTGFPNDLPVPYDEGRQLIRRTALGVLAQSAINNAAAGVAERLLISKYPSKKTLIRTISWAERIGFAALLSYRASAAHIKQGAANRRLAREYGFSR